ncbi:MAG: peptidoglycan-binding protein [Oscillospiraceae bacterium]|nr:peptidoglycan-binding protein [Oscillospiraceae bacterium]
MATGFLQVMVTTQTAIPLENVKITVIDSASGKLLEDKTVYTDASGQSPLIELETVDIQYTLDENNTTVLPYKNYDIVTEKEYFIRGENTAVQIYDGQTTVQTIGLMPRPIDFGNEFERELNRGRVQKLFDVQPNMQEGTNDYILQRVVIPQTVTVHLGRPDAARQNVTVPFRTYLKSVAASEIYPTWPQQALRANIHCQISFILNRIYTEWYRSRGYDFDITNSTSFDQKYIHNRATFESTDKIVDEIFNTYVTRQYNREPYFTEYCDGKQVTCRGLKQWGTVDLANSGMNALEIIRYYYGDDIQINETNNIASVNSSYPGSPLRRGATGNNVRIIQAQLNRISDNYPAIGKMAVDGIFGPAMEDRVKNFQRIFNLTADGVVGKSTWYKISFIYVAVKKLAELTSEGEAIQDGAYPGRPVRQGDRGLNVTIVQYYLSLASEYVPTVSQVALDGVFGSGTRTQVINFQRYYNLTADGVVGPATWEKMYRLFLSVRDGVDNPAQTPPQSATYPGSPLRPGSTGANVSRVQNWLNDVSAVYTQIPTLNVDGRYGPATQSAVIVFQQLNRLSADGVVGPQTWNRLYSVWQDLVADGLI